MAREFRTLALIVGAGASLAACATVRPSPGERGTMRPYQVNGVWYRPRAQPDYDQTGLASWYGHESRSRTTADGEIFDTGQVTGAHKTLPLPSIVEVTNLDNGRRVRVRLNDRGPFSGGRIIDLSPQAARALDFYGRGSARVRVRYVGPASAVTRPQPSAPSPEAVPIVVAENPTAKPCRVQVGAFADRENAQHMVDRWPGRGGASIEAVDRGGSPLYRVTAACAAA